MFIYIIKNKINDFRYVGKTVRDIDTRCREHINVAKTNIQVYMDMVGNIKQKDK